MNNQKKEGIIIFLLSVLFVVTGSCFLFGCENISENSEMKIDSEKTSDLSSVLAEEITIRPDENDTTKITQVPEATTGESLPVDTDSASEQPITSSAHKIENYISTMSLEEKVAQMFLCRNPKTHDEGLELIEKYKVGGVIFFARDFENSTTEEFKSKIEGYKKKTPYGLFLAVDEEGGTVTRVSLYPNFRDEKFLSPSELYELGGIKKIIEDSQEKNDLLKLIGINLNLAPVVDVSTSEDDFIYERTLKQDAGNVSKYASEVVAQMNKDGMMSALKHFPGYGNCADTHTGIVFDERSLDSFRSSDFLPFVSGISAGAPIVMVSHNIVKCMDSSLPASLSPKVTELLRSELAFDGIIMTDDLSMGAILDFSEGSDVAPLAVIAGADLLCSSNFTIQYEAVMDAVLSGKITEERINASVRRLLSAKIQYGILQ